MLFDLLHLFGILVWRSSGNCIIDQPFNFFMSLFTSSWRALSIRRSLASLRLRFLPARHWGYSNFRILLLKVLRTDVVLAKFGQICPFNTQKWFIFLEGSRWKLIPLLESLGVLFEQQRPCILHFNRDVVFFKSRFSCTVTSCYASKPSARFPKWRTFKLFWCRGFCCYNQVKR